MSKSERMQPVLQVTGSREEKAAKELAESQHQLQERVRRLADLESYVQEYLRHFHEVGNSGASAQRLNEIRRFLANLDMAVEQQKYHVELARQNYEKRRTLWQEARRKSMAVEKAVARFQQDEELIAERKEQKVVDEYAQNQRLRHRSDTQDEQ